MWGGNYFDLPRSRYFAVWDKGETMYGRDFAEAEYAWVSSGGTRIFKCSPVQLDRFHPTQKPVPLFKWCLVNYSKPGDLILDPMCGSGTTALACHALGRRYICIDKEADYVNAARNRLLQFQSQGDLFAGENSALVEENQNCLQQTLYGFEDFAQIGEAPTS